MGLIWIATRLLKIQSKNQVYRRQSSIQDTQRYNPITTGTGAYSRESLILPEDIMKTEDLLLQTGKPYGLNTVMDSQEKKKGNIMDTGISSTQATQEIPIHTPTSLPIENPNGS